MKRVRTCLSFSYKGTNPIIRVPPSWPNLKPKCLPKAPPPSTITLRVRVLTYEFREHTHSVHKSRHPWGIRNVEYVISFNSYKSSTGWWCCLFHKLIRHKIFKLNSTLLCPSSHSSPSFPVFLPIYPLDRNGFCPLFILLPSLTPAHKSRLLPLCLSAL